MCYSWEMPRRVKRSTKEARNDANASNAFATMAERGEWSEIYRRLLQKDQSGKLSGAEFDREYMMAMVDGHREVKNMLETRANRTPTTTGTSGRVADDSRLNSAVNQWAGKTLPVVTKHLERAEQISGRLK